MHDIKHLTRWYTIDVAVYKLFPLFFTENCHVSQFKQVRRSFLLLQTHLICVCARATHTAVFLLYTVSMIYKIKNKTKRQDSQSSVVSP